MWLLPSRGRPHLVERVFSIAPPTAPGVVGIDEDEIKLYTNVRLPPKWDFAILPRMFVAQKINALANLHPKAKWYGIVCDDQLPQTPGWDTILAKAAGPWGIAWADDCLHRRIGACVLGGELVRALGWVHTPSLRHFYTDDVQEMIAAEFGIGVPCMDVKIPHLHFSTGQTPWDDTYAQRPDHGECKAEFEAWKRDEWPALRTRLRGVIPCSTSVA